VLCVQISGYQKSAVLQCFEPNEDAGSSWQVAQPTHRCSSQAGWGPVTGRQQSVPVAGYCAAVVTCWSSTRQLAWLWFSIDRSESIKTPKSWADEEGSMEEEQMIGPDVGRRCWRRIVAHHRNSVLSLLSCRRLECIQSATALRHLLKFDKNVSTWVGQRHVFGCRHCRGEANKTV